MKNTKFIFLVSAIIIFAGGVFLLQNRSPVLPFVFFGTETVRLSVGLWLILSAIAGVLTSIILQLLLEVYSRPNGKSNDWDDPDSPPPSDTTYRVANPNRYQAEENSSYNTSERASYTVSNPKASPYDKNDEEDWESPLQGEDWNEIEEEWDIEQPPPPQNPASKNDDDETLYSPPKVPRNNIYERPQTPEKTSKQQGSVYSYRYREAEENYEDQEDDRNNEDDDEPNSPPVYDANYRVIRPPLWNLPDDDDDREQR